MSRIAYTAEIAAEVCKRIELGETVRAIAADPEMPGRTAIFEWLRAHGDFADQYARAREESAHSSADQVVDIAQDVLAGQVLPDAARVAIDALKWTAGKRKPKVYGDKVTQEQTGPDGGPVQHVHKLELVIIDPNPTP